MNLFDLAAVIRLDSSQYEQGLKTAESKGSSFAQKLGGGLKTASVAIGAGLAAASTAVIAFGTDAVKTGASFDTSMSQVAATMGKTVDEIQDLREFAQKMGAETAFSASQAADALNYMALAGYDSKTSMAMLPNVLNLAAAGNIELARASDMVTDAQSALGLTLEETAEMVDQMAVTSSKSNTSVAQLGDAFLTIGATARNVKGGTKELSAVLGVLADNGIKGAEGGTKLRNMIMSLQNPTKEGSEALEALGVSVYDADGNMRSLIDIIEDMQSGLGNMDQASRNAIVSGLFNKQDVAAVNALLGTTRDRFDELTGYISDADGAAKKMADTQLDNLNGDITLMKSALEGAKITLSNSLTPALRKFVKFGTKEIGKLDKAFQKGGISGLATQFGKTLGEATKMIVSKIPDIIKVAGKLALSFVDSVGSTITKNASKIIRAGIEAIKDLASALISRIPELMGGIGSIIGDVISNIPNILELGFGIIKGLGKGIIEGIPKLVSGVWNGIKGLFSEPVSEDVRLALEHADELREKYSNLFGDLEEMSSSFAEVDANAAEADHWLGVFDELSNKASLTKDEQLKLNTAVDKLNEIMPNLGLTIDEETGKWNLNTKAIQDNIDAMRHRAMADVYTEKAKEYLEKIAELNIEIKEEKNNLDGLQNRQKKLNATIEDAKKPYDDFYNNLTAQREELGRLEFTWDQGTDAMRQYAESIGITEDSFVSWGNVLQTGSDQLQGWRDDLSDVDRQIEISKGTIKGLEFCVEALEKQVDKFYNYADEELEAAAKAAEKNGNAVGDGFVKGMNDRGLAVRSAAAGLARAAMDEMKKVAMIASPSKRVRKEIGGMIGKGLAIGLIDEISNVEKSSDMLSEAAMPSIADVQVGAISNRNGFGTSNTNNYGGISINVYAADGQNEETIAEMVMRKIQSAVDARKAVFA